jgi:hypothetical protein
MTPDASDRADAEERQLILEAGPASYEEPLDMRAFDYNRNTISMILTDMLERGRG